MGGRGNTGNIPYPQNILKSAEIFNPLTNTTCSLPKLPIGRHNQRQGHDFACGGGEGSTQTTCVKWSSASGTWAKSHTLRKRRFGHVSWTTASGVYLIGGWDSPSSEIVKVDGSVEESFVLKYDTM